MSNIGGVACHDPAALSKPFFRKSVEFGFTVSKPALHNRAAARTGPGLHGALDVPADKSISHRALILASLAQGTSRIANLLESEDVLCTLEAMRSLGAHIERGAQQRAWLVTGFGPDGGQTPAEALDFGNAGTGARLTMGMVAGLGLEARFTGDESLSARPMERVLAPLRALGVTAHSQDGHLPVHIVAGPAPRAGSTHIPIASAQVKSALLLAGLRADGVTEVTEPALSRDHTERMLAAFGATVSSAMLPDGRHRVRLHGPAALRATDITVPGDPSSAAFAMAAALSMPGSDITLKGVLMNPARTGFVQTVLRMGGRIDILNPRQAGGEDVADLRVRASHLHGVTIAAAMAPSMIDEYPALAVLAAAASGTTLMQGIGELRHKESDRIARIEDMLKHIGVTVHSGPDWLRIEGSGMAWSGAAQPPVTVRTDGDHRIAMAALVLGLIAPHTLHVDNPASIATSYPDFARDMQSLGAALELRPC